jgi:hypothetical protein
MSAIYMYSSACREKDGSLSSAPHHLPTDESFDDVGTQALIVD